MGLPGQKNQPVQVSYQTPIAFKGFPLGKRSVVGNLLKGLDDSR